MGNSLVPSFRLVLGEGDMMLEEFSRPPAFVFVLGRGTGSLVPSNCVLLEEGDIMIDSLVSQYSCCLWGGGYDAWGSPSSPSIRIAFGEGSLMIGEWFC